MTFIILVIHEYIIIVLSMTTYIISVIQQYISICIIPLLRLYILPLLLLIITIILLIIYPLYLYFSPRPHSSSPLCLYVRQYSLSNLNHQLLPVDKCIYYSIFPATIDNSVLYDGMYVGIV